MPLPDRYQEAVPEIAKLWDAEGYFKAQAQVWYALCEARHDLESNPTEKGLAKIKKALVLKPKDIKYLKIPQGHETNRFLSLVQGRLPSELGNLLHRGDTSRDPLDTGLALQIIESLDLVEAEFGKLSNSLLALALQHRRTLKIDRTHGQHAVPDSFGRNILGWYAETERSLDRIQRSKEVIAFGKCSGEVGTNVFIAPELEELALSKLGLKPEPAPTQMIPRDRHAEVVSLMAVSGMGLARFALNIRGLARTELGELYEPFDETRQQGSSAMPHKRNTELTERITGLSRRIKSANNEALDTMEYWDEGDMSNSSIERFTFPDLFGCLVYCGRLANIVVNGLQIDTEKMLANLELTHGAIYSSRLLNAILDSGQLPRVDAYKLIQRLSLRAIKEKVNLKQLASDNEQINQLVPSEQLEELFDPEFYLRRIDTAYQRLGVLD